MLKKSECPGCHRLCITTVCPHCGLAAKYDVHEYLNASAQKRWAEHLTSEESTSKSVSVATYTRFRGHHKPAP